MTTLNEPLSVEEKRARLAQLLREKASHRTYPLSFSQERLWFLEQLEPDSPLYHLFTVLRLGGALNVAVLTQAVNELVKRHESLRTVFVTEGERPAQKILPELTLTLPVVDLRGMGESEREEESRRLIQEEAHAPFNLTEGPLIRAHLVRLGDEEYLALLNMHHIITDGWSVNLFIGEMAALYHAFSQGQPAPLRPIPMKYADYAVWQRQHLQGELLEKQITYWKEQLAGAPPLLELPTDHPRPPVQRYRGANHHFTLPTALIAALKKLSQQEGVTLFMTLLAAWKVLLYRYSGQSDVVVGSPIANRTRAELEGLMGFFVNTLVFRTDVAGNPRFRELLQRVRHTAVGAYNHQELPFEKLVEALQPPRNLSYSPLFQVLFVLQNTPKSTLRVAGLTVQQEEIESTIAKFDLTLILAESPQGLTGTLEYNRDLFEPETIQRLCNHFQVLLNGIVATPDQAIATLPLLTPEEQTNLLALWNETTRTYPQHDCWHEAFAKQAERTPNATAVVYGDTRLTYAELNHRANQLAHYLQALGVGSDRVVGLYLERSVDLIVGLMGILKAGGAYLPLDPTYPTERLMTMVGDARPEVIVTQQALIETLPEYAGGFVCLDRNTHAIAEFSPDNPPASATPDNLAYVIYTSGSTGKPKGVMIAHRPVMNLAYALNDVIGVGGDISAPLTVTVNGSVSFDTSVKQLVQLVHGHTLDITPHEVRFDGEALFHYLRDHQINLLDATPSQLRIVINYIQENQITFPTKITLIGGEPIEEALWNSLARMGEHCFYNVYGPTECTVDSTATLITADTTPTIGQPIANISTYVLDSHGQPVPIGIPGELHIGGAGVARGYLNHPAATATKFIPNPFGEGKLYKTGDLVRYRPDRNIEFIGRTDHQVKIRGYRIELGDIEATLQQHPDVDTAVVLAPMDGSGNRRLVAYVTGHRTQDAGRRNDLLTTYATKGTEKDNNGRGGSDEPLSSEMHPLARPPLGSETSPSAEGGRTTTHPLTLSQEGEPAPQAHVSSPVPLGRGEHGTRNTEYAIPDLRHFLQAQLPEYMIPTSFVALEEMPLTPNGKVDRKALAGLEIEGSEVRSRPYVAPRTPTEAQLAEIWASVLGIPQVGVEDNFFEVGGHSLLATQLASRIRTTLHTEFPLRTLFESPTIAEMAQRLAKTEGTTTQPIPPRPASAETPLSFAQERLWFLDQLEPDSPFYNIPSALRLKGKLDVEALERALNTVIARHETLRTYFPIGADGKPVQAIHPTLILTLGVEDLRGLTPAEREAIATEKSITTAQTPFNLAEGPLLRARLLQLADDEHLALLTLHHIITDGWSTNILVSELATLYQAYTAGNPSPLPELALQYGDFALWQRDWLQGEVLEQQVDYWKKQLAGTPPLLELPTDHPRPPIQTFRGGHIEITLPTTLTTGLKKISQREGVTLFMTLLAAFKVLLYRYSGQNDVVVGSPIANRTRTELETIIGFFVNTLVLRSNLSGNPTFQELLQQVRETTLSAYNYQDLPFEQVVEAIQPERNLSHSPLFQVMFVLQNTPRTTLKVGGLSVENTPIESGIAKFDLTLTLAEQGQELVGTLEYNRDLFDTATIERWRDHFQILLAGIVANSAQPIGTLPLLPPTEWQQVVHGWNDNGIPFDRSLCMHQWFEAQVTRTPNAIALIDGERRLTYHELHERANQLAHHLQSLGIVPEQFVGVCMTRTAELVIALLGILKSGGAYAPLDPNYPSERLAYIVENAQVQVILTEEKLLERLPATEATIVCTDRDRTATATAPTTTPISTVTANNLAYVIYTSGSTGRPKGVAITHANAGALFAWGLTEFTPAELQGMLVSTSINFDLSVYELFLPLSMGGAIILAENLLHLPTLAAANEVTLVNSVPSVLSEYFKIAELPPSVQTVNLAGEPLPLRLAQQVYQRPHVQKLYNLYGPSEDTTYSTWALIPPEEQRAPSIGRPIANTQLYLLDRFLQPVPIGVAGELYLGGEGVAQGYLRRPDITADRFMPDPFHPHPGARMYRTGDLARYRPDGSVDYLGRRDHQVKVRGFRIELGEIEAVLAKHPAVAESVVIVREDVPGDKRLVGYVVGRRAQDAGRKNDLITTENTKDTENGNNGRGGSGEPIRSEMQPLTRPPLGAETHPLTPSQEGEPAPQAHVASPVPSGRGNGETGNEKRENGTHPLTPSQEGGHDNGTDSQLSIPDLRQFLQSRLPSHMVPTAWVVLEALPQTPNGKVDRRALPAPDHSRIAAQIISAPTTPTEAQVSTIWAEVLRVEAVGIHDNFFELGGHSLLATQVVARIRSAFGIELPLRALFEAPTVAGLARRVESANREERIATGVMRSIGVVRNAPLSFAQERLWFLDQLEAGGSAAYNVMAPLRVLGDLDEQVLTAALNEVIRRHEALRTVFIGGEEGRPLQQILADVTITPTLADLRELPTEAQQTDVRRQIRLEAQTPFDLAQGPLVRLHLVRLSDSEHLILLTIHHIVTDGWSTNVLIAEIAALYPALLTGRPSPLPDLELQYADVAIWQRNYLQGEVLEEQVAYWKRQLTDTPPLLELPTDHPRPPVQRFFGANHYFFLPASLTPALKRLSHQEGATLFMTLLAAFKIFLYRLSGQSDIVVGSPIANRTRAELENLIGFFVNTLALRTELADVPDFRTLLQRIREVTLDAYAHQELPFEQLVEVVQPPRSLAHTPIFQVLFVLQNSPRAAVNVAGLTVEPAPTDGVIAKFDLTLTMEERQGGLMGVWEYNSDLFDRATMERWSAHFQTLLENIVAEPTRAIATLPLLNNTEQSDLIITWNRVPITPDSAAGQWLTAQAERVQGFPTTEQWHTLQHYILDSELQPVPIGVRGEWYLGGSVGDGMRDDDPRFIDVSFGERLFKTGELVRYRADGTLELLGRVDQLAKVQGVQIPLGEIIATIKEHPAISDCAVMVRHDPSAPQRLVGYIVPTEEHKPSSEELRRFLQTRLPTHQIPTVWVELAALPVTVDGTVDHAALPVPAQPDSAYGADTYVPPRTPLEAQLAAMWAELLQVERVGREDNFFALGGHSLLATQIVARVRQHLGVELPLRTLFEISTIAGLAHHIEIAQKEGNRANAPIAATGRTAPLSFAQERLWFLDQLEPNSALYNVPAPLRLQGTVDIERLGAALNAVVQRHEALRTRFIRTGNGQPAQQILPALTITPTFVDLSTLPESERLETARERAKAQAQQPFDLSEGPLVRLELVRLAENDHLALLTMHHIITDGWSLNVFISEIAMFYQALGEWQPAPLPPLSLQYADFARWQRDHLQGEVIEREVRYWQAKLKDAPPLLELPTDRPRPPVQRFYGGSHAFTLDESLTTTLKQISQQEGATLFMTLLGAFNVLLSRYSGQSDIVVGSPIANRTRAELEPLIGFFVNTLVFRTDTGGNPPFVELLRRVREVTLEAYSHQELPFEQVVEAVEPPRSMAHSPLFQVMFVLQNTPRGEVNVGGLTVAAEEMESTITKFDLTLSMVEQQGVVSAVLEYNRDLFDHATVVRMTHQFQTLLAAIGATPNHPIETLPLLTMADQTHLVTAWNHTAQSYPYRPLVAELVEQWAEQTPTATALVWEGGAWSYAELNRRANQLAHYLRVQGVASDVTVALCLPRSAELVMAELAILKAGGAYLPLDPTYPAERLAWMVQDSRAPLLLTTEGIFEGEVAGTQVIDLLSSATTDVLADYPDTNLPVAVTPQNLAYIIYTSGSTGTPKGTMLTHEGLLNLVQWHQRAFGVTANDRATMVAGVGFDASVWELFPYLTTGATLLLPDDETRALPEQLRDWLIRERITISFLPTPLAERVMLLQWSGETSLRYLLTGGDRLTVFVPPELPFTVVNNYGPTENTVVSTTIPVSTDPMDGNTPSIGYAIDNTTLYILDHHLTPVPQGVAGELYLSGVGLARGYLNRPALTAATFIPNPFGTEGSRLYRTRDLVRYRADGSLDFLGRADHQVKVRGFRIELGEIETRLAHHPAVKKCVVLARESAAGDTRLVAYVVMAGRGTESGKRKAESENDQFTTEDTKNTENVKEGRGGSGNEETPKMNRVNRPPLGTETSPPDPLSVPERGGTATHPLTPSQEGEHDNDVASQYSILNTQYSLADLRFYLQTKLPDYMVPSAWVVLEALPITPNGKVDRRALPDPEESADTEYVPPRTAIEAELEKVWAEVLGLSQVSIHANFFALGGHSLLAVRLLARMEERVGAKVPLGMLFRTPTIADIAAWLNPDGATPRADALSSLVPLQAGTQGRTPLFLIHPVGGTIFPYLPLVAQLEKSLPVYGIQAQGIDSMALPLDSIEVMAKQYVTLLRTVQPEGPYQLAGWSVGGTIAYEMAHQLRAIGQPVSLVMLDSHVSQPDNNPLDDISLLATFALDLGLPVPERTVPTAAFTLEEGLAYLLERARNANLLPPDSTDLQIRTLFRLFRQNMIALSRYTPRPYAGNVTLLRAETPLKGQHPEDDTLGWGALVTGELTVHTVPGNHFMMVRPPYVGAVAERIGEWVKNNWE